MKGIELVEVRDAIVSAFSAGELDTFLFERFDFVRANFVADAPFRKLVFDVLITAEQQGWDALLIYEVAKERPLRQDLQQLYRKYALALVDEGRRQTLDKSVSEALERFRLGPPVVVQKGGTAQTPAPVPGTEAGLERIVRPYLPMIDVAQWRQQLLSREGQVCRVDLNGAARGTGFLVGPDALMTNFHVLREAIEKPELAVTVKFRFDFQQLPNGGVSEGIEVSLAAKDWLIDYTPMGTGEGSAEGPTATADQLDFALVRLDRSLGLEPRNPGNPNSAGRGWITVPTAPPLITGDPPMPILILQHPNAQPLKLAVDTAGVIGLIAGGNRVRYTTNTEPGSSGSPCFNINWTLVALHHVGDRLHDQAQFNQGIPIYVIRERLQRVGKAEALGGPSPM